MHSSTAFLITLNVEKPKIEALIIIYLAHILLNTSGKLTDLLFGWAVEEKMYKRDNSTRLVSNMPRLSKRYLLLGWYCRLCWFFANANWYPMSNIVHNVQQGACEKTALLLKILTECLTEFDDSNKWAWTYRMKLKWGKDLVDNNRSRRPIWLFQFGSVCTVTLFCLAGEIKNHTNDESTSSNKLKGNP